MSKSVATVEGRVANPTKRNKSDRIDQEFDRKFGKKGGKARRSRHRKWKMVERASRRRLGLNFLLSGCGGGGRGGEGEKEGAGEANGQASCWGVGAKRTRGGVCPGYVGKNRCDELSSGSVWAFEFVLLTANKGLKVVVENVRLSCMT